MKLGTCAKKCKGKRKGTFKKCVKKCMKRHRHHKTYYTSHRRR